MLRTPASPIVSSAPPFKAVQSQITLPTPSPSQVASKPAVKRRLRRPPKPVLAFESSNDSSTDGNLQELSAGPEVTSSPEPSEPQQPVGQTNTVEGARRPKAKTRPERSLSFEDWEKEYEESFRKESAERQAASKAALLAQLDEIAKP
jgi:hypothetical protein